MSITGFNWADPRDNYATDVLVPSGLEPGYSPADAAATARAVARGLAAANPDKVTAIRMPINPATTSDPTWWPSYRAAIDAVIQNGQKVILGHWEAKKDGRIDDQAAFDRMWDSVEAVYGNNGSVLFEPMNEPFGYSDAEWTNTAAAWLARHPVDPSRVIIAGTGYSENVVPVGQDSRLAGTMLGLHIYPYWSTYSRQGWIDDFNRRIGDFASRVVITEFGAEMTTGTAFSGPGQQNTNDVHYLQAVASRIMDLGLGSVYWPGLRDDDSFSMTVRSGEKANTSLRVTNQRAIDLWRSGHRNAESTIYPNVYCYSSPKGQQNDSRNHLTKAVVQPALGSSGQMEVTYLSTPEKWDSGQNTYVADSSTSAAVRIKFPEDISGDLNAICTKFTHLDFGQPA